MEAIKWILIGAFLAIGFAGCYTKLVHPPVTDETGTYYHPRKQCSDCHSSADYYYYHFPYYYDRWGGGRYWRSYYSDPWWYHDYWWWDDNGGEGLPTGTPRYWDERERPGTVPKLVPPAGATKTKDGQVPAVPGGSSGGEVKEKPKADDSGSEYYKPRERPDNPKEEPKEVNKEEKKAKEKQ
jgi:hypothetical protein